MHNNLPDQNSIMTGGTGSEISTGSENSAFVKIARYTDLEHQNNVNALISTLPATNKEGKRVRYISFACIVLEVEIEESPSTDNTIQDDNKIRGIETLTMDCKH
jgi:hypothetical protein